MAELPPKAPLMKPTAKAAPKKTTTDRDYGTLHQKLRKLVLQARPMCEHKGTGCTGWSTIAHHLRRPATSTADYQAVCRHCHTTHIHAYGRVQSEE